MDKSSETEYLAHTVVLVYLDSLCESGERGALAGLDLWKWLDQKWMYVELFGTTYDCYMPEREFDVLCRMAHMRGGTFWHMPFKGAWYYLKTRLEEIKPQLKDEDLRAEVHATIVDIDSTYDHW